MEDLELAERVAKCNSRILKQGVLGPLSYRFNQVTKIIPNALNMWVFNRVNQNH